MRLIVIFLIISFSFKIPKATELNIIRDAEIENFLSEIANELLKDTKIKNYNLNFYLDNKNYVNALVIPGPNFFFTTKLLIESKSIDQIAGVVAHELGHVVGGHFTKMNQARSSSSIVSIISSILAIGAAAGGSAEAASAIMLGGQHLSKANLLSFSRSQESFADQTSIRLLKKSGFSLEGMIDLFKLLERREKFKQYNPYSLTHPLSSKRKNNIKMHLMDQNNLKEFPRLNQRFALVKAKLNGFFLSQDRLEYIYPEINNLESFYAYSLRYYRVGKVKEAIKLLNKCIEIEPKNAFFFELKGQIFFENGNIPEAIKSFKKAINILPSEKSFKLFLAKSLYYKGDWRSYDKSIKLLWSFIKDDDFPVDAWHYLGLNFSKIKKLDYSSYAFAEKFYLVNQLKNARIHISKVKKLSKDPVLLKKVADLENEIIKKEKK